MPGEACANCHIVTAVSPAPASTPRSASAVSSCAIWSSSLRTTQPDDSFTNALRELRSDSMSAADSAAPSASHSAAIASRSTPLGRVDTLALTVTGAASTLCSSGVANQRACVGLSLSALANRSSAGPYMGSQKPRGVSPFTKRSLGSAPVKANQRSAGATSSRDNSSNQSGDGSLPEPASCVPPSLTRQSPGPQSSNTRSSFAGGSNGCHTPARVVANKRTRS